MRTATCAERSGRVEVLASGDRGSADCLWNVFWMYHAPLGRGTRPQPSPWPLSGMPTMRTKQLPNSRFGTERVYSRGSGLSQLAVDRRVTIGTEADVNSNAAGEPEWTSDRNPTECFQDSN